MLQLETFVRVAVMAVRVVFFAVWLHDLFVTGFRGACVAERERGEMKATE